MARRFVQFVLGIGALALAAGLVVGIPYALIMLVGWPLPTAWPSVEQLRQFSQVGVTDATIAKSLALVVWIAWVQIALAIVVETAAILRRHSAITVPVFPGVQPFAARLVAAVTLIAATTATPRTGAVAMPLAAAVGQVSVTVPASADVESEPLPAQPRAVATELVTVTTTARDSWWGLAERHLGDGMRWREIRDLNDGRQVATGVVVESHTDHLQEGWEILVPGHVDQGRQVTAGPVAATNATESWTVEKGDHFWGIAEETLQQALDRNPTEDEVREHWVSLVDLNRDRLRPPGDPNFVYPGQAFDLPPVPAGLDVPGAPQSPEVEVSPDPETAPSERPAPPDVTPGHAERQVAGWRVAIERPERAQTSRAEASSREAVGQALDDEGTGDERNALGVPTGLTAGVAAASVLAAGVAALVTWRRRAAMRQRPENYRLPTPLIETELGHLEAAAMPEQTLDDLASLLCSIPEDAHPALVSVTDDGLITLLFDDGEPVPEPPAPWRLVEDGADGPVGWEARLGERGPERSIGLPLLVTLGRTGETTVMANVGAMSLLAVAGPPEETRRRMRTMAMEAATSRIAVPVEVVVAGDDSLASLPAIRWSTDLAAEVETALAEVQQGVVPEDRSVRLLVGHVGSEIPDVPAELRGTVGVVTTEAGRTAGWVLGVADSKTAELRLPDGGTVTLDLPEVNPAAIDAELDRLEDGAEPAPVESRVREPVDSAAESEADQAPPMDEPWCEVRLLGPTEVVRGGARVEGLTARPMEILAYLATHRDGVSKERLEDAVWSGRAAAPTSQRVTAALTKVREALGEGPDGAPLVPRRTAAQRIQLSDHVGTDIDRALGHISLARDLVGEERLDELAAALDLVRGEPFEELPVSWASEITQRVIAELQDAALEVSRARRQRGDFDGAEHAARHGLRLLDPADSLYLELAEIEKQRGHPERVRLLWQQLRQRHADDADETGGLISQPPAEIELAFRELLVDA